MGILFEPDPAKKAAMEALAEDMFDWFDRYECTSGNKAKYGGGLSDPPRAFNWQNKSDPYGTYKWVTANSADDGTTP